MWYLLQFIFLLDFIGKDGDIALHYFQFHHGQQTIFQFNKSNIFTYVSIIYCTADKYQVMGII